MRRYALRLSAVLFAFASAASPGETPRAAAEPDWSVQMTVLESCSCPLFCQCFFTGKPPASCPMKMGAAGREAFCRFNQAYKVDRGHFGPLVLDGAMFWFAGDAGPDFARPKLPWAVLRFDSSVSRERAEALTEILHHLHFYRPERWSSYQVEQSTAMTWSFTPDIARALLDGGKVAEIVLRRLDGGMNDRPVTMKNMDYFGYPRNTGFLLMPNEIEAYRAGDKPFEYRGTNGLVTTVEISSQDVRK